MCDACAETRNQPRDYYSNTVADAAKWQWLNAQPAEPEITHAEAMRDEEGTR